MSSRSGPYEVETDGGTWTYEHDFAESLMNLDGGDVFRIWAPSNSWAIEILLSEWREFQVHRWLPISLTVDINRRFELPDSYAVEHNVLWKAGVACKHCARLDKS